MLCDWDSYRNLVERTRPNKPFPSIVDQYSRRPIFFSTNGRILCNLEGNPRKAKHFPSTRSNFRRSENGSLQDLSSSD